MTGNTFIFKWRKVDDSSRERFERALARRNAVRQDVARRLFNAWADAVLGAESTEERKAATIADKTMTGPTKKARRV